MHLIADISKAISEKDNTLIAAKAHYMKGSSANLRINTLEELFLKLENAAKSNELSLCDMILKEINEFTELLTIQKLP